MDHLKDHHILVTGGGAPGAPGILKCIKQATTARLSSCDAQSEVPGQIMADEFFAVPEGSSENYSTSLLEECKKRKIDLILPITTKEVQALSKDADQFQKEGIHIVVSPREGIQIANNKGNLYRHLQNMGIAVPEFSIAETRSEALTLIESKSDSRPYVFKPCISNGSRGFRIVDKSFDQWAALLNHKPSNTTISPDQAKNLFENGATDVDFLFSEYLPGDEYSVDCLVTANGRIDHAKAEEKINNGISTKGIITQHHEIIDYCRSILRSIPLKGPIGIQVKMNNQGMPLILEINPRLQGTSSALKGSGVNLPHLALLQQIDELPELEEILNKIRWEVSFARIYEEIFFD